MKFFAIFFVLALAALGATQTGSLKAVLAKTADVQIWQGEQPIIVARFDMRLQGQGALTFKPDNNQPSIGASATATIPNGGNVRVVTTVSPIGGATEIVMDVTPSVNINSDVSAMSLGLYANVWRGGTGIVGAHSFSIIGQATTVSIFRGFGDNLRVRTLGGLNLTVDPPGTAELYIQDSTQWVPYYETWINNQTGTWLANQTRQFRVTISGPSNITIEADRPFTAAQPDWVALNMNQDIVKGSILDWTPRTVTVAGSKGWLKTTSAGKFVATNEPTKPLKFLGVNLSEGATVPDRTTADKLVQRLGQMGYNAVRLHHYERFILNTSIPGFVWQTSNLNNFDYLIYKLKQAGIFIKIDLYASRPIRDGEVIAGPLDIPDFKALLLVNDNARQNWLTFSRQLLDHVNPYTGLRYRDEPALAWICLVNEGNVEMMWSEMRSDIKAMIQSKWELAGGQGLIDITTDEGARFLAQLHADTTSWMTSQLRSFGVKALITDINRSPGPTAFSLVRKNLDFVDMHYYFAHPKWIAGPWMLPHFTGSSRGTMVSPAGGGLSGIAIARLFGKPLTLSEFDTPAPNPYRGEMSLILGTVAAIQDWDALWRYSWSHHSSWINTPNKLFYFNAQTDPLVQASERIMASLYLRGDMKVTTAQQAMRVNASTVGADPYFNGLRNLLFTNPIGHSFTMSDSGSGSVVNEPERVGSANGPVYIDGTNGTFQVNLANSAGFIAGPNQTMTAGFLQGTMVGTRGTVWVTSFDGRALKQSSRMLLTLLTDLQNTNARYSGQDREVLEEWGTLPYLVRNGGVDVSLAVKKPATAKVYRVDTTGKRIATVPTLIVAGRLTFRANVSGSNGAGFYYEILN